MKQTGEIREKSQAPAVPERVDEAASSRKVRSRGKAGGKRDEDERPPVFEVEAICSQEMQPVSRL